MEKIIRDGGLKVCLDGTVYRKTDDGWALCKEHIVHIRNHEYRMISWTVLGVQKHEYVHRLLAEAFLPNDDPKKNKVYFKDGDSLNISLENLVRGDQKDVSIGRPKKEYPRICIKCGRSGVTRIKAKADFWCCADCQRRENQKQKEDARTNITMAEREEFRNLLTRTGLLHKNRFVAPYLEGKGISQIARENGLSRQRISTTFINLRKKALRIDACRNPKPVHISELSELSDVIRKAKQDLDYTDRKLAKILHITPEQYRLLEDSPMGYPERTRLWWLLDILGICLFLKDEYVGEHSFIRDSGR